MADNTISILFENAAKLVEEISSIPDEEFSVHPDFYTRIQQLIPEDSTPESLASILSQTPALFEKISSVYRRYVALYYLALILSDRCWVLSQAQADTKPIDAEIWNRIIIIFDRVISLAKESDDRPMEALALKGKACCLTPYVNPQLSFNSVIPLLEAVLNLLLTKEDQAELIQAGELLALTGHFELPPASTGQASTESEESREEQQTLLNEDEIVALLESRNMLLNACSPLKNPESSWADYRRTAFENEVLGIWLENREFRVKALFDSINGEMDGNTETDLPLPMKQRAREAATLYRELGDATSATSIEQRAGLVSSPSSRVTWVITIAVLVLLVGTFIKGMDGILTFAVLGLVLLIHEVGHWIASAICGIPIEKFCIGVGAKIYSFSWRRTLIEVRLLPLLGYVQPASMTKYWFEREKCWLSGAGKTASSLCESSSNAAFQPIPLNRAVEEVKSTVEFVSGHRRNIFYLGGVVANFIVAVACLSIFWGDISPKSAIRFVASVGPVLICKLPVFMKDAVKNIPTSNEQKTIRTDIKTNPRNIFNVLAFYNMVILWFNLIPLPPLDGFKFVENSAALILRRETPQRLSKIIGITGWGVVGFLILLNIYLMIRDNVAALLG